MSVPLSQIGLRTTALRDNVRVFTLGGESIETSYGANCTAVAGRESVLLVDPLIAPAYARHIEGAVASWTPLPIRFVLVTHHHTDHALGAGYFASRGATVVAHAACRDRMAAEHSALIESRRAPPRLADGLSAEHLRGRGKPRQVGPGSARAARQFLTGPRFESDK